MHHRHILRDVFWLSLPVTVILVYLIGIAISDFHKAEVENFHGYPARSLRIGGLQSMFLRATQSLGDVSHNRFLSSKGRGEPDVVPNIDLRVKGVDLDALDARFPKSSKKWRDAWMHDSPSKRQRVSVHYRGQLLTNYFFHQKSWKIKTKKRELWNGYRLINLTPLSRRLESHLSLLVAREVGLPAPRARVVRLFVNMRDEGLYLQEEQIDESMIRRAGRMPGDVFYGELFIPEEPKRSSNELFWNPYVWEKRARNNRYSEQYRPHLEDLLDQVCSEDPGSWDRLYNRLEVDEYALYFALLSFQGDHHVDHAHNHKLYFDPLLYLPYGEGVETVANRMFKKLARDPRFLDRVHRLMHDRLLKSDMTLLQLREHDRIRSACAPLALDPKAFVARTRAMERRLGQRGDTVRNQAAVADLHYEVARSPSGAITVQLHARATASLRLRGLTLNGPASGVRLFEDRDFDGVVGEADRELKVDATGDRLEVLDDDALLYVGRDFSAGYDRPHKDGIESYSVARDYTRLASLASPLLLVGAGATAAITGVDAERTVGEGAVTVRSGAPDGFVATETVHPWRLPAPAPARTYRFAGEHTLREDLIVRPQDKLLVEPDTTLRLAPGVSIVVKSRAEIRGLTIRRLVPNRPWGVFVIQGKSASSSRLERCDFRGGSDDTIDHVYYSGMLSVHYADKVSVVDSVFAKNVLGDDTVRFAKCHDLLILRVTVSDANGDAIDCDISTGKISHVRVISPRNDGIDLMTANVDLSDVLIEGAGDKGISVGESANPLVERVRLIRCVTGLGIKDGSDPLLRNCEIKDCRTAIASYDKNWRYPGGGRGRLVDCVLSGNRRDVELDRWSTLVLERCSTRRAYALPVGLPAGAFREIDPREGDDQ